VEIFNTIKNECSDFISASHSPLFKLVNISAAPVSKIKIRSSKKTVFGEFLNESLSQYSNALYGRTVFCSGTVPEEPPTLESAIIFIPNNFRYFHGTVNHKIRENFDALILQSYTLGIDIYDVLSDAYAQQFTLSECVDHCTEIGFYGIPYYYAVRLRYFHEYEKVISIIHEA
jgi:hypothetical protein